MVKIASMLFVGALSLCCLYASGDPCNGNENGQVVKRHCVVQDCGTIFHWGGTIWEQTFAYWCCYDSAGNWVGGSTGNPVNSDHATSDCCHYDDAGTSWFGPQPACPSVSVPVGPPN